MGVLDQICQRLESNQRRSNNVNNKFYLYIWQKYLVFVFEAYLGHETFFGFFEDLDGSE